MKGVAMSYELMSGRKRLSGLDAQLHSSTHTQSAIAEAEGLRELVQRLSKEVEKLRRENESLRMLIYGDGV